MAGQNHKSGEEMLTTKNLTTKNSKNSKQRQGARRRDWGKIKSKIKRKRKSETGGRTRSGTRWNSSLPDFFAACAASWAIAGAMVENGKRRSEHGAGRVSFAKWHGLCEYCGEC